MYPKREAKVAENNPYEAPRANLQTSTEEEPEYQPIKLLSTSGRIGRVRYIGYTFVLGALSMASALVPTLLVPSDSPAGPAVFGIVFLTGWVATTVLQLLISVQRCHDFDITGWLALLTLLPLVVFVFFCIPGTKGPNRWGYPPPPNRVGNILLALGTPILIFCGFFLFGFLKGQELIEEGKRKSAVQLQQSH
jgi:uncharacterized membrane protein YhaH (DUF805 family)